jgi:hypothetical protein
MEVIGTANTDGTAANDQSFCFAIHGVSLRHHELGRIERYF